MRRGRETHLAVFGDVHPDTEVLAVRARHLGRTTVAWKLVNRRLELEVLTIESVSHAALIAGQKRTQSCTEVMSGRRYVLQVETSSVGVIVVPPTIRQAESFSF